MIGWLTSHQRVGFQLLLFNFLVSTAFIAQRPAPEISHKEGGTIEVGVLSGAPYRIDIPRDWNHSLVVYYHGYSLQGPRFKVGSAIDSRLQPFLDRHYAVIQSAYSQWGWAIEQAVPETESLRLYFLKNYGSFQKVISDLQKEHSYSGIGALFAKVEPYRRMLNELTHSGAEQLLRRLHSPNMRIPEFEFNAILRDVRTLPAAVVLSAAPLISQEKLDSLQAFMREKHPWIVNSPS